MCEKSLGHVVGRIARYRTPSMAYYNHADLLRDLDSHVSSLFLIGRVCAYKVLGINAYKQEQDEADTYSRMWRWRSENRKGRTMASTFSNFREALDRIGEDQVRTIP
ncbi:hypothetical protein M9H77_00223 [Catharanthus roseus]|nr:hypothetical protein M9H77_00223 [Catharanthus roseus]